MDSVLLRCFGCIADKSNRCQVRFPGAMRGAGRVAASVESSIPPRLLAPRARASHPSLYRVSWGLFRRARRLGVPSADAGDEIENEPAQRVGSLLRHEPPDSWQALDAAAADSLL
jgi:hypothetical protein